MADTAHSLALMPSPLAPTREPFKLGPWLLRELRIGLPISLGIAVFLSLMFGDFWLNLVYSLCIGLCIQFSLEGGRYGMAHLVRRLRPEQPGLDNDWPGWLLMGPWILLCVPGGYVLGTLAGDALTGHQVAHPLLTGNMRSLAFILTMSMAVSVGATYFFYSRGRIATTEARAEAARRAAAETQLMLLQSQLEPHMLFNTLANLRVLIGLDSAKAQAMLDHLIGFLRSTLTASRASSHPLSAEFARIEDYLALMRIRMGGRLQVSFELPDDLRDLPVPPLLLQPLVENSIQHGLEPKVAGGRITLSARRNGPQLWLTVRDTGVGLAAAPSSQGTGFGTTQVRERLAALFGANASLVLSAATDAEGGTLAEIALPLTTSPTA